MELAKEPCMGVIEELETNFLAWTVMEFNYF
jgi:hypothetical protein